MSPKFLYFDMGNVLLNVDHNVMLQQMGQVAGIDPRRVGDVLLSDGLQMQYELGRISTRQFYEAFCEKTGTTPDCDSFFQAGSDIFELNVSIVPVVAQLQLAGYRMGILSNTCESHWEHCTRRFRVMAEGFQVCVLSYRINAGKPDTAVYRVAAELAGTSPSDIFFTDDKVDNVVSARTVGFDAVHYTSTFELVTELRRRGIHFNY